MLAPIQVDVGDRDRGKAGKGSVHRVGIDQGERLALLKQVVGQEHGYECFTDAALALHDEMQGARGRWGDVSRVCRDRPVFRSG